MVRFDIFNSIAGNMQWLNLLPNNPGVGLVDTALKDPVVYVVMRTDIIFRFLKINATNGD